MKVTYLNEKIIKKGSNYQVQSEKGKNMGTYKTKEEAMERLKQIEFFKHKNENLSEATVKKQSELKNTHIPHMNQFIADGKEGLERFNDFISSFINVLETGKKDDNITLTNKKDGAPCLLLLSHMEGYHDNSVGIKSMISNPANAYSSYWEIEEKANPNIQLMLKYALDMAHCIPEGEMWQGDCLFAEGGDEKGKSIQNINNKEYLIYKPNTIAYGHEKGSNDYDMVEKAKFGIAFHTIHKGQPGDLKQSFKIDLSRLKDVPEDYYVTKTELDYSTDKTHYDFEGIKKTYNELVELENKLINDPSFEELVNNAKFRKYWDMFENKTVSSEAKYINPQTFIGDLKEFINGKIQGYFDKGRISQNVRDRDLKELEELVENNKEMLLNYIGVVNKATDLDNLIIRGLEKDVTVDSFIVDDQGNYIYYKPGEGFVLSKGGLSGKFVDRDVFSKLNRFGSVSQAKATESLREEVKDKIALVTMGKYNPITVGHLEQINYMLDNYDGDVFWFFSGKQDNKNHPLTSEENEYFANKLVGDNPRVKVRFGSNPFRALYDIYKEGYNKVIYFQGGDYDGKNPFAKYKQEDGKYRCPEPTPFVFDNIDVVISGSRQKSISGTDLRQAAIDNDFERFKQITPFEGETAKELFDIVRERMMSVNEELIDESTMSTKDISKHDFKYFDNVINDLSDQGVKLKDGSDKKIENTEILDRLNQIKDLESDSDRVDEFNYLTGFNWRNIDKSKYTGKGGNSGQSRGQASEAMVCYLYNHLDENVDIDLNDKWNQNALKLSNFIDSNWSHKDWYAVHVDGSDIENNQYQDVGKLFKSKSLAEILLRLPNHTLNDLYITRKDNWNKADIILVRKGSDPIKYLIGRNINNGTDYNQALISISRTGGMIVPLSLKSVMHKNINDLKIVPEGFERKDHAVENLTIKMPTKSMRPNEFSGSVYLEGIVSNEECSIQFRAQEPDKDNLSIEAKLSIDARGGKGISNIKNSLDLHGNGWYSERFNSDDELMNNLKEITPNITPLGDKVKSSDQGSVEWYNRTCFRGLVNLYHKYLEKYPDGNGNTFFMFIYELSTIGSGGAFYLIK